MTKSLWTKEMQNEYKKGLIKVVPDSSYERIFPKVQAKKKTSLVYIWLIILLMPVLAVALAEFLKWTDDKPEIRKQLYLD